MRGGTARGTSGWRSGPSRSWSGPARRRGWAAGPRAREPAGGRALGGRAGRRGDGGAPGRVPLARLAGPAQRRETRAGRAGRIPDPGDAAAATRMRALHGAGTLAAAPGRLFGRAVVARESLATARELGDRRDRARPGMSAGWTAMQARFPRARARSRKAWPSSASWVIDRDRRPPHPRLPEMAGGGIRDRSASSRRVRARARWATGTPLPTSCITWDFAADSRTIWNRRSGCSGGPRGLRALGIGAAWRWRSTISPTWRCEGELDAARMHHREWLAIAREVGDRRANLHGAQVRRHTDRRRGPDRARGIRRAAATESAKPSEQRSRQPSRLPTSPT